MQTMNIALPTEMKNFVRVEVSQRGYSSASEYIRDLIRQDQLRKAETRLESLLLAGVDSGASTPITPQDWKLLRERLRRRHGKRNREA